MAKSQWRLGVRITDELNESTNHPPTSHPSKRAALKAFAQSKGSISEIAGWSCTGLLTAPDGTTSNLE